MNLENESIAFEHRMCHCVTSIRQYLIIYGGRFGYYSINACNELWIYDTINGICRKYPAPDRTRETNSDSSICTVGNKVYIFGSRGAPLDDGTNYCLVSFDIRNFSWQDLTRSIDDDQQYSPPQMFNRLLFYHDVFLYVLGNIEGVRGDFVGSMYKFSLQTNIWSPVEQNGSKPVFFHQITGTVFKNKFYAFGHGARDGPKRFTFINIFDFSNNTWTSRETVSIKQTYPDHRVFESSAFSGSFLFISGGQHRLRFYFDIWRIDLENLEWIQLEKEHKTAISMHRLTVIEDCYLYSFGGHSPGYDDLNMFERFVLRPPPLYRLCLESISRSPNLRSLTDSLPSSIVDELNLNNA